MLSEPACKVQSAGRGLQQTVGRELFDQGVGNLPRPWRAERVSQVTAPNGFAIRHGPTSGFRYGSPASRRNKAVGWGEIRLPPPGFSRPDPHPLFPAGPAWTGRFAG